jgi:hypothetical protein
MSAQESRLNYLMSLKKAKMAVFWVVAPIIALMMEAARTSETLANFYQTTRRYNPEDSHLRTHRRENLKPYLYKSSLVLSVLVDERERES